MTDDVVASGGAPTHDERISFRGPLQRMLISPEIGALIGTIMVWTLFWATSEKFSTAPTSASWLDGAAPLGIMAVAVALLMIGGEFDLSAGVITGSTGILVGLFAQKFMGDGVTMYLAVPVAFAAAGMIGWLNGTFVNRTGLPSFIVTLATFFILRGVNLVFSKRLVDKVLVENIDEVRNFEIFRKIFASTHTLETFGARDTILLLGGLIGGALLVAGLLEQSLVRRAAIDPKSMVVVFFGLVITLFGVILLHKTDGVSGNLLWGGAALAGALLLTVGYAGLRFVRGEAFGAWWVSRANKMFAAGIVATVVAFVVTRFLDKEQERVLLSIPAPGVKVAIGVLAFATGAGLVAWSGAKRMGETGGLVRRSKLAWPVVVVSSLGAGLATLVGVLTFLQLITEQGFRSLVQVGVGGGGILAILVAKGIAGRDSNRAQLVIGAVASAVVLFTGFVVRHDAGAARFRSGFMAVMAIIAALILGNAIIEFLFRKRRAGDAKADGLGRVLAFSGVGVALIGIAVRLVWSGAPVRVSILWWLIVTLVAAYVLARTRWGNWIFAVGGNKEAARAVGVPVNQTKVGLFMMVSLVGCLVGMMTALRYTSVAASQGVGEEFEYIIAAVVGGCLLTGGYGSVVGASFGAMIAAMLATGIPGARWNTDNKYIFLGAVLFLAVLVNQKIRKKAQEAR